MSVKQNDGDADTLSLYVWLSRDDDDVEGVVAGMTPDGGAVPLVFSDLERAQRARAHAQLAAQLRGKPAKLVQFNRGMTMDVVG